MKDEIFDQLMRQALTPEITTPELQFRESEREEYRNMRKMNMKRIIPLVLAACLVIGGSCFAASKIAGYRSGATPNEFTSYSQMGEAEKEIGYPIHSAEAFSNGFAFDSMSVKNTSALDESGHEIDNVKGYTIDYTDAAGRTVFLNADRKFSGEAQEDPYTVVDSREFSGITVKGCIITYKVVPDDYELTEEDQANLEHPDFEISYGSDKVEEMEFHSVSWTQDGIEYLLQDAGGNISLNELFDMAQELIEK